MTQFDPLRSFRCIRGEGLRVLGQYRGRIRAGYCLSGYFLFLSEPARTSASERVRDAVYYHLHGCSPRRPRCFEQFSPGTNQTTVLANTSRAYSAR